MCARIYYTSQSQALEGHQFIRWALVVHSFVSLFMVVGSLRAAEPMLLKENWGWCWFQGERAVVVGSKLFFTSIAGDKHGGWEPGDLVATSFDMKSGSVQHTKLHERLQSDDHDVAGLCVLPDKRLLAVYGKHGSDSLQRSRSTLRPADISAWTEEAAFDVGARYTYSNVYALSSEQNRIYNFHRGRGFNPNCSISDDTGQTWQYGFRLLTWTHDDLKADSRYTGLDGSRPYVNYASRGVDSIHFFLSDDHPRAYDNSVYHGYYENGYLHRSNGERLRQAFQSSPKTTKPRDFTEVFVGGPNNVAWPCDIQLDEHDRPSVLFSVQVDSAHVRKSRGEGGLDHRYYYGRWNGERWHTHEIAHAGTRLYPGEDDYTGLAVIDPHDPNTVVISTNADPVSGKALISAADGKRHWELFVGQTNDLGVTWQWSALTSDSTEDQLRPLFPASFESQHLVLWTRGKLNSYTDYHLDFVATYLKPESERK